MNLLSVDSAGTPNQQSTQEAAPRHRLRWFGALGLIARLSLGGVLLLAGYLKVTDPTGAIQPVVAYDLFPYEIAQFIGLTLPVVEIAIGVLLVLGVFTRAAAGLWLALRPHTLAALGPVLFRGENYEGND